MKGFPDETERGAIDAAGAACFLFACVLVFVSNLSWYLIIGISLSIFFVSIGFSVITGGRRDLWKERR
jgi:hypothetical protein